jgi:hypothetical protein
MTGEVDVWNFNASQVSDSRSTGILPVHRYRATNTDRVLRWWEQPVNESQDFKSRVRPSQVGAAEQLRSANSVDEFSQRVSKLLTQ